MNQRRIMGGVKPSPPLSTRTEERPNPRPTRFYPFTMLDPHEEGNWHRALPTSIPNISWAIYRLRRARVGQLPLFGRKRKVRITRKIRHIVPFWGCGVSQYKSRKRRTS